jgi:hypothetical protein
MHEARVVERRGRLEARDVAAELGGILVGPEDDRQRVPPDGGPDPVLDRPVARMGLLPLERDRVDVGRRRRVRDGSALPAGAVDHLVEEESSPLGPVDLQDAIQRVEPFLGLGRIGVAGVIQCHLRGGTSVLE